MVTWFWQSRGNLLFCETRPKLTECRSQHPDRFDATHFSLHGLWPQPGARVYCGVDQRTINLDKTRKWRQLKGLGLSDKLRKKLWQIMPGTLSFLHRHEWVKHGTCYSTSKETYYADSAWLIDQINGSPVRHLFENAIGKNLTGQSIRQAFDDAFGDGVGNRIRLACKKDGRRTVITELTLGISGRITERASIGALALASPKTKPGCAAGIIDSVGLQ